MAAALQSSTSTSFASSSLRGLPSSFLSTRRSPFFGLSTAKPLPSWTSLSRKSSSSSVRRLVSKSPSAKYIREDYLVKKVSAKAVQDLVNGERNAPLIVDFYATWCGPCIIMAQQLEMAPLSYLHIHLAPTATNLAVEYESNALFVKVDTDDEYEFAQNMQVRGLPTLYFISPDPNKDAIRTEGLVPSEMIKNIIDNEM
ncbi:Thioredoxin-like protein CITRX, chloroplastic [Cocos nucifera]|uniref:Thioredoxin-like protein CITRX, chloroplastic n=1 Tax=Cocos nucifera TaxID=13894 RepID=A0A8K0IUJ7_COCNU|nr:Thioredoxin-like protein CITRX, chloroplastic [Cocos nucifera]